MKKIATLLCMAIAASCSGPKATVTITRTDGSSASQIVKLRHNGESYSFTMTPSELVDVKSVELLPEFATVKAGYDGYLINPDGIVSYTRSTRDSSSCYTTRKSALPISISKTDAGCWMGKVTGLRFDSDNILRYGDGIYTMSTIWNIEEMGAYDKLSIEYYKVKGGTYSDATRMYRQQQIDRGEIVPLTEKVKTRPELKYAAEALELRIRLGWKPVPTPVLEQTLETEPEMHVAITFDRVKDIIDELKAQGVDKAEICLVGWNVKGHDGRFPDIFPVEEQLGGEEKLRELIRYAQDNGFQIVAHTNRTDIYHISKDWNDGADVCKKADGSMMSRSKISGGLMYYLCYKQSYEKYFKEDEPKVAALGFRGLEFIDVLSVVIPHECYDENHFVNRNQAADYAVKMLKEASDLFGGIQSEGGIDFCASVLDFAMYTTMEFKYIEKTGVLDDHLPIWQMVYNGYILSNPADITVNYTIKKPYQALRVPEYGARPIFYFYSAYRQKGANWMGEEDLTCATDEELKAAVSEIRKGYDYMKEHGNLMYATFDRHEVRPDGTHASYFSDGTIVEVNYADGSCVFKTAE